MCSSSKEEEKTKKKEKNKEKKKEEKEKKEEEINEEEEKEKKSWYVNLHAHYKLLYNFGSTIKQQSHGSHYIWERGAQKNSTSQE